MQISRAYPLPHANHRPSGTSIDTVVIHCMYAAEAADRYSLEACIAVLDSLQLSAHYLISREGVVALTVEESLRAWHAGVSKMPFPEDSRENVNNFSIGIELIGSPEEPFTHAQYGALTALLSEIITRHPITAVVGHHHIAPTRKIDPGPHFDWQRVRATLPPSVRLCS